MKPLAFFIAAMVTGGVVYFFAWMGDTKFWFSIPSMSVEIIAINVVVTSAIYFWLARTKAPALFVNSYLLSIVLKLGFFSFLLVAIRIVSPQTLTANAVLILVCYFVFTFLEVAVLFAKVNR